MVHLQDTHRQELKQYQRQQNSNWFYSTAFAIIALVALMQDLERFNGSDKLTDQDTKIKWVASGIICALGLACIGVMLSVVLRQRFVGNMMELLLAILTVGMWAAVLPTIMNPKHNIATEGDFGQIINANLFIFPWLGLLAGVNALSGAMKLLRYQRDTNTASESAVSRSFINWGAFEATSLIVMMAAARQYEDMECDDTETTMCDRLQYATWLGAIGGFLAFIWMLVDLCVPNRLSLCGSSLAVLLLIGWCFGITYITFSDNAPAPFFSTLYFFSWGSFALSCGLVASGMAQAMDSVLPDDESVDVEVDQVRVKEVEHSESDENDDEERGKGAVVQEDEGIAAVPPTNDNDQIYK